MATPQTATQTLPGGIRAVYTLEGQNGTLTLRVTGPNGVILGTATNSYANRNQVLLTVSAQVANEFRAVEQKLVQVQQQINELNSIISNPASTPEQKAEAERQLNRREFGAPSLLSQKEILEAELNNLRNANLQLGSEFSTIVNNLNEAATAPPTTPTITNTEAPAAPDPAGTNTLQGTASDDSGSLNPETEENAGPTSEDVSINAPTDPEAARETPGDNNIKGTPPYENEEFIRSTESPTARPGRRVENPLGYLASYTYQLSLYMISPDAHDAFIASGRKNINLFNEQIAGSTAAVTNNKKGGAFLVAQSGGAGSDPRIPGNKFDYYIDNLSFKYLVSAKETMSPVGTIDYKFQIVEPYGFSLISNLKRAGAELEQYAKNSVKWDNKTPGENFAKQFFMLGIRFYGWDNKGRAVTGEEIFGDAALDPSSSKNGAIFETFYELTVTEIKYKLDGKATVYTIDATHPGGLLGSNTKKGVITSDKSITGSNVRDMLSGPKGLITLLNEEQQNLKNNNTIEYPVTYKVRWVGDAELIALSSVVSDTRTDKANQPANESTNTAEVNDNTEVKASPSPTQATINLGSPMPIIQGIDNLISRSKYLEDAMTLNYTDNSEYDPEKKAIPSEQTPKTKFKWFRVVPEISNIRWDNKLNDWAYDITYEIKTYLVPVIDNPYVANNTKYYGPHKRYDYWYTGENKEVLSYEQTLDNNYMNVVVGNSGVKNEDSQGNAGTISSAANTTEGLDQSTAAGTLSTSAVASVKTNLYDPTSFVKAKLNILGDPDFLMREVTEGTSGLNDAINRRDRFYEGGDSFRVNPTGGQIFIEVDFKEAVDYSASSVSDIDEDGKGITGVGGTLSLNDSILFWDYSPEIKKIVKGISYTIVSVVSNFKNGLFTQTLDLFVNDFQGGATFKDDSAREELSAAINQGRTLAGQDPINGSGATGTTLDAEVAKGVESYAEGEKFNANPPPPRET